MRPVEDSTCSGPGPAEPLREETVQRSGRYDSDAADKDVYKRQHLHLPLQSGSSRILKEMNRRYTKEQYLDLVERIRRAVPDISLTTDIIVGFPGETEEDFQETLDVVRKVRFDSAFTFIYSRRSGTPAARMEDQVPEDVVKDRFDRLLNEIQEIAREEAKRLTGTVQQVLVEEKNDHDERLMTGRMTNNMLVHFPGRCV